MAEASVHPVPWELSVYIISPEEREFSRPGLGVSECAGARCDTRPINVTQTSLHSICRAVLHVAQYLHMPADAVQLVMTGLMSGPANVWSG